MISNKNKIDLQIRAVQKKILTILDDTYLKELTKSNNNILNGGKMLRSKLVQYLGLSSGTNNQILVSAGAAVDIMHSASLIHDDVIDGGLLRRNEKAFWKKVIEDLNQEKNDIKIALDIMSKYNCLNEAKAFAESYAKKASEILKKLPKNDFNISLNTICQFVFKRKN